ncbi:hypothetical protein LWI28_019329 [Acer negundo]|uniref:Uncharacterized protein n=1 Tax=Acer negundo TaxID=4023 RepID=A0AAD5IAV5_ACENE|nr:hypothetical protein LWI28_019329 [Acer negundo]
MEVAVSERGRDQRKGSGRTRRTSVIWAQSPRSWYGHDLLGRGRGDIHQRPYPRFGFWFIRVSSKAKFFRPFEKQKQSRSFVQ